MTGPWFRSLHIGRKRLSRFACSTHIIGRTPMAKTAWTRPRSLIGKKGSRKVNPKYKRRAGEPGTAEEVRELGSPRGSLPSPSEAGRPGIHRAWRAEPRRGDRVLRGGISRTRADHCGGRGRARIWRRRSTRQAHQGAARQATRRWTGEELARSVRTSRQARLHRQSRFDESDSEATSVVNGVQSLVRLKRVVSLSLLRSGAIFKVLPDTSIA
jgi:hypothetical protein